MTDLTWVGDPLVEGEVKERQFTVMRGGAAVPGILWLPAETNGPVPLVIMGHGGSGHKRSDRQLMLARRFASIPRFAAVTIDGPNHGDRAPDGYSREKYLEAMAEAGIDKVVDGMVADWTEVIGDIVKLAEVDGSRMAYIGFSMGTRFGLPLVASLGDRLKCAVLGKNGMRRHDPDQSKMASMKERFEADAPKITVPVLFHAQWDDELFPNDAQIELFDAIASPDKELVAYPGAHVRATQPAIDRWVEFVLRYI